MTKSEYRKYYKTQVYCNGAKVSTIFAESIATAEASKIERFIYEVARESGKPDSDVIYAAYKIALEQLATESIEYLERCHFQPNTPEWRRLEEAKLDRMIRQRNNRIANIANYKQQLEPEEFEQEAIRLGWDLEEFNKYYQPKPAPAKSNADKCRDFLEDIFKNVAELSVDEIKTAALLREEKICWKDENGKLQGFEALRQIAYREGYTGGREGFWCDPLKQQPKAGEVQ